MPAPTVERLKVRCYRCNQLLAVAPGKAGAVVACPKCKAELLIPRPDAQPADEPSDALVLPLKSGTYPSLAPVTDAPTRSAGPAGTSSFTFPDEIAALIPPEVAALRPEDLRVEAEVFETIAREPRLAPALAPDPFVFPGSISTGNATAPMPAAEPELAMPPDVSAFFTSAGAASTGPAVIDTPPPLPQPGLVPSPAPEPAVVPPISIEPEMIRPSAEIEPRAIREVVLPASVVLAWSFFVLLAIPMAFVAGLMIGHFLWTTGP